ncbi:PadR family transcriptional regulator [Companilactobacillus sp.]|uniref:PadR family transcriptional regulator n=1 Tax=Companilactobacillus sp. TaxID=2767905 RepID=UPI0026125977|nr:PadR family transcriptional regulator [Companilactobacillus sp.]
MAQKNRLQYIILGLLNIESQTGYDLTKSFDSDIGEFWSANHSQIYPLLKKMEEDNLISHHDIQVGTKLVKKSYDISDAGKKLFDEWLQEPSDLDNNHDEFILKLYFINDKKSELLKNMVAEQLNSREEKLSALKTQMSDKFPNATAKKRQYGHFCVLQHAIEREAGYIDWLKQI